MKSKLFKFAIIILTAFFSFNFIYPAQTTYADVCGTNAPEEVRKAAGCPETGANNDALQPAIEGILNGIIAVCGLIAVVFVVIGGINYMTSSGDPGKIEKAKKTILYACIGLVIAALAFAIVNFIILRIIGQKYD